MTIEQPRPSLVQRLLGVRPLPYDPSSPEAIAHKEHTDEIVDAWWEREVVGSRAVNPTPAVASQNREALTAAGGGRGGLAASAARITGRTVASSSFRRTTHESWQDDGWAMFDLVGELRFLATTLAHRTSKARLYVGKIAEDATATPEMVEDQELKNILEAIGDGHLGQSQLIERMSLNLFIPGDVWLVGIPKEIIEAHNDEAEGKQDDLRTATPNYIDRAKSSQLGEGQAQNDATLDSLEWRAMSISEVQFLQGNLVRLRLGPTEAEMLTVSPDDIYLVRVWRAHPRFWWQADSPVRSSLPILRELVGLTMHISAQVDSRLAGAGVFIIPESASRAVKIAAGLQADDPDDPFTEALMQSMLTPIGDRSNASAIVPLAVTVPDDAHDKFHHLTFASELDTEARPLREEAIRRLALGLDAPPELLLGTNAMNHWGAWLVQEEVVSAHIEPPLILICDALTTQYLRPILIANGMPREEAEQFVIWYNVDDLIIRPNRGADAQTLFDKGLLSPKAVREANGFDESDAPLDETDDPIVATVLGMLKEDPGLMLRPGLDIVFAQVKALLDGVPLGAVDGASPEEAGKAVTDSNVEDVHNNPDSIEPISPPSTPVQGTPGAPPTTSAPLSNPTGPGAAPLAVLRKPADLHGTLSAQLAALTSEG